MNDPSILACNPTFLLKLEAYEGKDRDSIEDVAQSVKTGLITHFTANFVLSFFSSHLLQYLWSMINTLQIIMLTSLFKLKLPESAKTIMTTILKLCAVDIYDTDSIF